MSVPEQAYAIFDYCYSNIIYTGTSDKTDWKSEAYRGLTEGVGDCFTFYSASYALLLKRQNAALLVPCEPRHGLVSLRCLQCRPGAPEMLHENKRGACEIQRAVLAF